MKRIFLLAGISLFLSLPFTVTAQTVTVTPSEKRTGMIKNTREQIKTTVQERNTAMKERRTAFTQKLKEIKDARKKTVVERVDTKLATINKNRTDSMTKVLERLETLLAKFSEKANTVKGQGVDTASVESAITEAETAIANAKTAVLTQAAHEYTPEITDETTLRETVGAALKTLQNDLKTTYGVVTEAKRAVMKVAEELAKVRGSAGEPTASPTVTE